MTNPPDTTALDVETDAINALLAWIIRKPNEAYAYSRCRYCDHAFWDREAHNFGCIVPALRAELAALVQDKARLEDENMALREIQCGPYGDDLLCRRPRDLEAAITKARLFTAARKAVP